ncbi:S8 family serine peptidase, partial [Herbiconiux sp. CPCC 203406]
APATPAAELLRASEAAAAFGVDGSGVRVGIISDSFDTGPVPTAADDVAAGVLPGPGNPCGYEKPVRVVAEGGAGSTDEGRAMAQLLHGVAPGAELLFASTGGSNDQMVESIRLLREAGVDIIVDDVGLDDDLFFERGSAAVAVEEAVEAGILYLAAAGNYGEVGVAGYPSEGFPISSWSTLEYRPTECPAAVAEQAGVPVDCLDFDAGAGADPELTATLPPNTDVGFEFFWGEPSDAVTTQFGLAVTDPAAGETGFRWAEEGGAPRMRAGVTNLGDDAADAQGISIVRRLDEAAGVPPVAILFDGDSHNELVDLEHFRSTETDTVGSSLVGHQADPSTIAVAAVDAGTLGLETYSSAGPSVTLFGVPSPTVVPGPAVAGLDALPISFPLGGGSSLTFRGTSAAAPTVAAVAALVKQADPAAGPAELRAALESSARPDAFSSPWDASLPATRFSGAGLVDAVGAVAAVLPAPTPTPAPVPVPAAQPAATLAATGADASGPAVGLLSGLLAVTTGLVLVIARRVRIRTA